MLPETFPAKSEIVRHHKKVLTVKALCQRVVHAPPREFLRFSKSARLCNGSVGRSSSAVRDGSPNFLFIKYQGRLLLPHPVVTGVAAALLIIDLVLSLDYDIVRRELNPLIALFVSDDVGQVGLEDRLLLRFVALIPSHQ